jgi:quercetin dioxygenase-like cupin family protein
MAITRRAISFGLAAAPALVLVPGQAAEPDPKIISFTLPDKINWRKSPSADMANLVGNQSQPGMYIQMIKWHPGNTSRPHMHDHDRFIMVLSGTWWMGWGPKYEPDSMFPVKAGTFVVHHANELHYDGAKDEEAVLYIVGNVPRK